MRSLYFGNHPRSFGQAIGSRVKALSPNPRPSQTLRDLLDQFNEVDERDSRRWENEHEAFDEFASRHKD